MIPTRIEADYLLETPIDPGEAAQIMGHTLNVGGGFRAAGLDVRTR